MSPDHLIYTLALQRAHHIGDITAKKLIHYCGSAEMVFKEKSSNLTKINGIGEHIVSNLKLKKLLKEAEHELKFITDNNINYWYYEDMNYPKHLKHCVDSPIVLFNTGFINLNNNTPIISIVGTRKLSSHGRHFCEKLIQDLSVLNPTIISGFAYGTDISAHKFAMENNLQTIACMAHGLNQIYPKPHKRYVEAVESNGGFVTDFWSDSNPDRENFLKRNRIIAGLSEATIVIESANKGGSLVTADIANSYNRDVFAVPGRPNDSLSEGCNTLIKYQKAQLISSAADLIYHLNWSLDQPKQNKGIQQQLCFDLSENENTIVTYLTKHGKSHHDTIANQAGLASCKVASIMLNLELKGLVRPLPGKQFEMI